MERRLIIEVLCESLHSSDEREAGVAREFLADILVRSGESLDNRLAAAFHLTRYLTRKTVSRGLSRFMRPAPFDPSPILRTERAVPENAGRLAVGRRAVRETARGLALLVAGGARGARTAACRLPVGIRSAAARTKGAVTDVGTSLVHDLVYLYRKAAGKARGFVVSIMNRIRDRLYALALSLVGAVLRVLGAAIDYGHAVAVGYRTTIAAARRLIFSVVDALKRAGRRLVDFWMNVVDALLRAIDAVVRMYVALRRLAFMELLPETSARPIVASVVFAVLLVFGMNWYFIIKDVNKKGIFVDMTRYEWGDEALASMMMGEAYDIYLQEKITEKKIKELLASGRYYERVIHVTGYYSPLPNQDKYATGSYWGDIKLNGRGIMGGDTTPVYFGMAAGPPHMKYGTNLIIKDLGKFDLPKVYTVHDRGGAIVGNRLDIWVGRGEEAMKKAYEITGNYRVIIVEK